MTTPNPATPPAPRRDLLIAFLCGGLVAGMVGLSFAAVPFYSWFCRTTGYGGTPPTGKSAPAPTFRRTGCGGTPQTAKAAPAQVSDRTVTVRFDSNVAPGLPWRFEPEQRTIDVKLGEVVTVYYTVTNEAARVTAGQAGYNVSPATTGIYFTKINCFCFTEQTMKPGEKREMAVVFYVDPGIVNDHDNDTLNTITLSYTFYPARDPAPTPVAARETDKRKGDL